MITKQERRERTKRFSEDIERITAEANELGLQLRIGESYGSPFYWMFDHTDRARDGRLHVLEYWPGTGSFKATFRSGRYYCSGKHNGPRLTPDEALKVAVHVLEHDTMPPGSNRTLFPE